MAPHATPSPATRWLIGLTCIAAGLMPLLASFDVGPLDAGAINGPRWLGFLAGAIFIAAGAVFILGRRLQAGALGAGFVALVIGSFAAIGNWIAFGPGPRECSIAAAGFLVSSASAAEIACRAGFGIGALLLDGFVLWMIAAALRALIGPGALPTLIEKAGGALILIALAPIIVPMLIVGVAKIFIESLATWRKTGRWPRNEAFIRRMKAKRAAKP